jgi:long-chain fatty acid transport protein
MMRKVLVLLCMLGMVVISAAVYAGSIDYLSNQSAEYLMTFSRTAATDSADIAYYNPAGTVFMPKNGLYINGSVQYLFKPYEQKFMGTTYKQDDPSQIPETFVVYKKDAWAAFFALNITAGGGRIMWKDGDATTRLLATVTGPLTVANLKKTSFASFAGLGGTTINSMQIGGSSVYKGFTPGLAYKVNDMVSVSLAGRAIIADRYAKAKADFLTDVVNVGEGTDVRETHIAAISDFDYSAHGFGGIIGFDVKPVNNLLLALRYETHTQLDFNYNIRARSVTVSTVGLPSNPLIDQLTGAVNGGIKTNLSAQLAALDHDGKKARHDLPAMLALGVNYTVTPGFDVMSGLDYYFLKDAVMSGVASGAFKNGWELSVGSTYKVKPDLKLGIGLMHTVSGETHSTPYNTENPGLDSNTVGLGGTYSVNNNLDLTLTGARTQYISETQRNFEGAGLGDVKFKKVVNTIAAGGQYRFDM